MSVDWENLLFCICCCCCLFFLSLYFFQAFSARFIGCGIQVNVVRPAVPVFPNAPLLFSVFQLNAFS